VVPKVVHRPRTFTSFADAVIALRACKGENIQRLGDRSRRAIHSRRHAAIFTAESTTSPDTFFRMLPPIGRSVWPIENRPLPCH
jgi:hypothetical protein